MTPVLSSLTWFSGFSWVPDLAVLAATVGLFAALGLILRGVERL